MKPELGQELASALEQVDVDRIKDALGADAEKRCSDIAAEGRQIDLQGALDEATAGASKG